VFRKRTAATMPARLKASATLSRTIRTTPEMTTGSTITVCTSDAS